MNGGLRLSVNLATRPLESRRLYRAVLGTLIALFLVFGGGAGAFFIHSTIQGKTDERAAADFELRIQAADKERSEKAGQSEAMRLKNADLVAEVNGVIARKNFSWVNFFSRLEEALPPGCSIAAFNPLQMTGTNLQVSLKVLTPGLPELLILIENLSARKFQNVTMKNETTGGGRLISEIGFLYDGSH